MADKKEKKYVSDNAQLMAEWDWEKNTNLELNPHKLTHGSEKKAWWKCGKGHEWQAKIYSRSYGSGCPICNSDRNTSLPEYVLLYYLNKYNLDVLHSYKKLGYELDIYIPSKKIAIEYDGYYWHKNKRPEDLEKNKKCENDKIKLYRIREGLPPLNDSSIDYTIKRSQKDLPETCKKILSEIVEENIDIDLAKDALEIENLRYYTEKQSSLLILNPKLAEEWNYKMNGNLKPEFFSVSSQKKLWWECKNGHSWQATVANRNYGYGCPYCATEKSKIKIDIVASINQNLVDEWNYDKNNGLTPLDISPNSSKNIWWKCSAGHEWQARVSHRSKGSGCPYCAGQKVLVGTNDLQTVNPILAKEWNFEKNGEILPVDVMPNSHKNVWWKCDNGHEWQMTIKDRNRGRKCPECSKIKKH